jgi:hypothetical protein
MNSQALYALTAVNVVIAVLGISQHFAPAQAQSEPQVLRGRALEIVDREGRVRASIQVLPASRTAAGEPQSETVLLRLITEQGRPTVKLGASEPTSGLSFAGPTGTRNAYVILQTSGHQSLLRLRNEDGREQRLAP